MKVAASGDMTCLMPLLDAQGLSDRSLRIRRRGEFVDVALLHGDLTWAIHGTSPASLEEVTHLSDCGFAAFGPIFIRREEENAVVSVSNARFTTTWRGLLNGLRALAQSSPE